VALTPPFRLVQLARGDRRRVAVVDEPTLRLLDGPPTIYEIVCDVLRSGTPLSRHLTRYATDDRIDYDAVYTGASDWRLLTPVDHPEPARCLVSGTGLTHFGSATSRDKMHAGADVPLTDSMRMFRAGVEAGRPSQGSIGVAPEWFYKGNGSVLRAPGEPLVVPGYAEDGGEEAEVAGIYVIDAQGQPRRIGMAVGNEFSDHKFEKHNYLNLAGSKLRTCALGPELVIDPRFDVVRGRAAIERRGTVLWQREIATGEQEMCHSLANLEHHHFKFEGHRRAGDVHVHFFGAHSLSFADEVRLEDGDVMTIEFEGFGRPLRNPVTVTGTLAGPVTVQAIAL
jgi:hypothetical protein